VNQVRMKSISNKYGFIRSRQLEGTYPGPSWLGCWNISVKRVFFGWGAIPKEAWDFQDGTGGDFLSPEPPGLDQMAKSRRICRYLRVRTSRECRKILRATGGVMKKSFEIVREQVLGISGGFEITREFVEAPLGELGDPDLTSSVVGSHAFDIRGDSSSRQGFSVGSGWKGWGHNGIGFMPYPLFDRWVVEAWAIGVDFAKFPGGRGLTTIRREYPDPLGGVQHVHEIYDADADDRVGWALAVVRDDFLDIEDLFVKPMHRGRGHGRTLAASMSELAQGFGRPFRLWIPFADIEQTNRGPLKAIVRLLGLGIARSGVRWAPYLATAEFSPSLDFYPVRIPNRPAAAKDAATSSPLLANLQGTVLKYENPYEPVDEPWES